jgi:hypothetical protein
VQQLSDDLAAEIRHRWESATADRDRGEYDLGRRLCPRWAAAYRLLVWLQNPDLPYTPPRPTFPGDLEYLEYRADLATGGAERISPPLEPADAEALQNYYGGGKQ